MIEITLFLYGKPQWELHAKPLTTRTLQRHIHQLHRRMERALSLMHQLQHAGWHVFLDTYSLVFYHKDITTLSDARLHLEQHNILLQPNELHYWKEEELR